MGKRKRGDAGTAIEAPQVVTYVDDGGGARDAGSSHQDGPSFARRLPPELRAYLTDISASLDGIADDPDQREPLVAAVLAELGGAEVAAAADADGSRLLERIAPLLDGDQALALWDVLTSEDELYTVATSPYGSHVFEKLLQLLESNCEEATLRKVLSRTVAAVCKSLWDLVMHKYGSYVARALLAAVAGSGHERRGGGAGEQGGKRRANSSGGLQARVQAATARPRGSQQQAGGGEGGARFPQLLEQLLAVAASDELDAAAYGELSADHYASPFLQALLRAAKAAGGAGADPLIRRLLGVEAHPDAAAAAAVYEKKRRRRGGRSGAAAEADGGATGVDASSLDVPRLQAMMRDRSGSHLMECVFAAAAPPTAAGLYRGLVGGSVLQLAQHPVANFVVQSALAALEDADLVGEAAEELNEHVSELLLARRGGVVAALLAALVRVGGGQRARSLCNAIAAAAAKTGGRGGVDGGGKQEALKLPLLRLLLLDTHTGVEALVASGAGPPAALSTIGCAILTTAFQLPQADCQAFANGIPQLTSQQLRGVARHPGGCRVLEAFLEGPASAKQRRALLQALAGGWPSLTRSAAGTMFLERCYDLADAAMRESIVEELAGALAQVQSSRVGSSLAARLRIDLYARDPTNWRRHIASAAATQRTFSPLLSAPTHVVAAGGGGDMATGGRGAAAGGGDKEGEAGGAGDGAARRGRDAMASGGGNKDFDEGWRRNKARSKTCKVKVAASTAAPAQVTAEAVAAGMGGTAVDAIMGLLVGGGAPPRPVPVTPLTAADAVGRQVGALSARRKKKRQQNGEQGGAGGMDSGGEEGVSGKRVKKKHG